jgi:uncharacterized protein YndB with AHSA1/START domain
MHDDDATTDRTFRALADPGRRRMLDLLKARPGMNVSELTEHFEYSRFGVMKHLKILEAADLVVSRREGKQRRLYLNAVPIQTIHDRWISSYSKLWASSLTSFKYALEQEETPMEPLTQVYVTYVRTTPERLWEALTQPDLTRQYFHGTDFHSELTLGSAIEYELTEDGESRIAVRGEIIEIDPPHRLAYTFAFAAMDDPPTTVRYEMESVGEMVKMTVIHEGFEAENETWSATQQGWPPILSGLKTLLETGQPLRFPAE